MSTPTNFWVPPGLTMQRNDVYLPPEYMQMLAAFAEMSKHRFDLILRCSRCDQEVDGRNAMDDNFWRMQCSCRAFSGASPIRKPT